MRSSSVPTPRAGSCGSRMPWNWLPASPGGSFGRGRSTPRGRGRTRHTNEVRPAATLFAQLIPAVLHLSRWREHSVGAWDANTGQLAGRAGGQLDGRLMGVTVLVDPAHGHLLTRVELV